MNAWPAPDPQDVRVTEDVYYYVHHPLVQYDIATACIDTALDIACKDIAVFGS